MHLLIQNILGNECNKKLASPNVDLTLGVIGALPKGNLICLFCHYVFKHYNFQTLC
jgi:hypothetical protein